MLSRCFTSSAIDVSLYREPHAILTELPLTYRQHEADNMYDPSERNSSSLSETSSPKWHVKSFEGSLGGEVIGLHRIDNLSDMDLEHLKSLLWTRKVLLIRLPHTVGYSEQITFSKRFSSEQNCSHSHSHNHNHSHSHSYCNNSNLLDVHIESSSRAPGYPDVTLVSNILNREKKPIGLNGTNVESFHSDLSWSHRPAIVTFLYSVLQPSNCGNTIFINTETAYSTLPDFVKSRLNESYGKYCYLKTFVNSQRLSDYEKSNAQKCAFHPIFTRHPITNKWSIFANPSDLTEIIGLSDVESNFFIDYLSMHVASHSAHRYTHRYSVGDLLIFDNRGLQHRGTGCAAESPRLLHRTIAI